MIINQFMQHKIKVKLKNTVQLLSFAIYTSEHIQNIKSSLQD